MGSKQYFTQSSKKGEFSSEIFEYTNYLFKGEKQKFTIIWGDRKSYNQEQKTELIQKYPFLLGCILQCVSSQEFRKQVEQCFQKNVIYIMSGSFATEIVEGTQNIEWLNNKILNQEVHSKAIILFTSQNTIQLNNWTIKSLQDKFQYVTQLAIYNKPLFDSIDKMIYNRLHRSLEQVKNLDLYFGSKTDEILQNFQNSQFRDIKKLRPSTNNLKSQLKYLCDYIRAAEMKTPIIKHMLQDSIDQFYDSYENQFVKNETNNVIDENSIVEGILNLYTKETNGYRILNFSLNTMNPIIYNLLSSMYQLFSKCLHYYNDNNTQKELILYRGSVIQKYQYDILYKEYKNHIKRNSPTLIIFPQFISTTTNKAVALDILKGRVEEVAKDISGRINQDKNKVVTQENLEFLKSNMFIESYNVVITIETKIDIQNLYRPKSLKKISDFKKEEEFLFQPFQAFKLIDMDEPKNVGKDTVINMKLFYEI